MSDIEISLYQSLGEGAARNIFESLVSIVLFESHVWAGVLLWVAVALGMMFIIGHLLLGATVWSSRIRDKEVDAAYEEVRVAEHQVAHAEDPYHKKLVAAE